MRVAAGVGGIGPLGADSAQARFVFFFLFIFFSLLFSVFLLFITLFKFKLYSNLIQTLVTNYYNLYLQNLEILILEVFIYIYYLLVHILYLFLFSTFLEFPLGFKFYFRCYHIYFYIIVTLSQKNAHTMKPQHDAQLNDFY